MKTPFLVTFFLLFLAPVSFAQSETIFSGTPIIKISEGGTERLPENLPRKDAVNLKCIISKIGEKYYWASRENTEMVRKESGAFVTFLAINGSGYVRIISPKMKDMASLMGKTEANFDYVEHLLTGLRSITYYGTNTQ